ncbi:DUF4265 domain-containing protein [Corallococcus macrosporus]|uniref:DUF4265 domain-containing protein n=1 Tax=Myxococcus fulvus (strain ATCC BAA-855 / HW-1) TaxID=483219 RepID=F8CNV4_MYXFH|nr:DUF4265 domain-containing protein [Corallococcus macrosporus]AEI64121.1 hypothetical protein LILAB_11050 [Corallococcus macrosporus]
MSTAGSDNRVKVIFELERDEDDYPPADSEGLWARPLGEGLYQLDNVPFFAKGVACEDVVSAEDVGGELLFQEVVRPSGHATLRLIVHDEEDVPAVKALLEEHGCAVERSHVPGLISVDVPPTVPLDTLKPLLDEGEDAERWGYEEACLP